MTQVHFNGLIGDYFANALGNKADEFKQKYEEHFKDHQVWEHRLINSCSATFFTCCFEQVSSVIFRYQINHLGAKDLSQNPDPSVKRGRKDGPNGSLPTFTRSSSHLSLFYVLCSFSFVFLGKHDANPNI